MIAEIIPLTRLPAHLTCLDYLIPEGCELVRGDLVRIPLRGSSAYGIVSGVKSHSDIPTPELHRLKTLIGKEASSFLKDAHQDRLQAIARVLGESPAMLYTSALQHSVPTPRVQRKSSIHRTTRTPRPSSLKGETLKEARLRYDEIFEKNLRHYATSVDPEAAYALVMMLAKRAQHEQSQLLVLLPSDHRATLASELFQNIPHGVLTGKTPPRTREELFSAWHSGELPLLLTTRQGALWEGKCLFGVVVLDSGNDGYTATLRRPLYDPREAGYLLARDHEAFYISLDTLPRVEDVARIPHDLQQDARIFPDIPKTEVISLRNLEEKTPYLFLTATLLQAIEEASQQGKRVLLFLNRKGAAKRLFCKGCSHTPRCGTCGEVPSVRKDDLVCPRCHTEMWIPTSCPECGSAKLVLQGVGSTKVLHELERAFPQLSRSEVQKDEPLPEKLGDIILVTEFFFSTYLEPFVAYNLGVVADLFGDLGLHHDDIRVTEKTARHLARLSYLAHRENARCIIQTFLPERLPPLQNPRFFFAEELALRERYRLPPFGTMYTTRHGIYRNPTPLPTEPFSYDGTYDTPYRSS